MSKDAKRGTANCAILSETDDSFVTRQTPMQTKRKEMSEDSPRLGPPDNAGIDRTREKWTTKQRNAAPRERVVC